MTITGLDNCLAEACMMRQAHAFISAIRGQPACFRPLALARAELWALDLGRPETRMQAWVTMRDIVEQTREEWTR